jgi:hypothetical protein
MNKKSYIGICTLFSVLMAAISNQAAPGGPDTTFGVNGKAVTPIGTIMRAIARGVAVQADGKIGFPNRPNAEAQVSDPLRERAP